MARIYTTPIEWNQKSFTAPEITAYPEAILRRLLKNVPAGTGLHPQIRFYDADYPDAFVLPGGQIYISRQIANYLDGEDELAALVAHEMGHALTRQATIEFSQAVREQLGIYSLPDPASVLDAYNRLLERESADVSAANQWAKQEAAREELDQEAADRTALYLLASAGYPPHAMVDLFNRIAETHGKTGSWLANLFQLTTPDQQRLRALEESLDQMPTSCRKQGPPTSVGDFSAWRAKLIAFNPTLSAVPPNASGATGALRPGFAADLSQVRFSPNGQYLLARDPSGILVFSAHPLRLLLQIDAPDARHATFSANSQGVLVRTTGLRVEQWNIGTRKQVSLHMAVPLSHCWTEADSPDGRYLVVMGCGGSFSVIDESTGQTIFTKSFQHVDGTWGNGVFSPDGRYFVAKKSVAPLPDLIPFGWLVSVEGTVVAFDFTTWRTISLHGGLKGRLLNSFKFIFLTPSRLAVLSGVPSPTDLELFAFPSGRFLAGTSLTWKTPHGKASAQPTYEDFVTLEQSLPRRIARLSGSDSEVLLSPFYQYPGVIADVAQRRPVAMLPTGVADLLGSDLAFQHEGWLSLFDIKTRQILGSVELPTSLLGSFQSVALSPDLKWLAISNASEGAIYNLSNGSLIDETSQFTGAWFGKTNALYVDFPEKNVADPTAALPGSIVKRINLETSAPPFQLKADADESQYGPFLLVFRTPTGKKFSDADHVDIEIHQLRNNNLLWKRPLPEEPLIVALAPGGGTLLLGWPILPNIHVGLLSSVDLTSETLRHYLQIGKKDTGYAFQIFDPMSGKLLGHSFLPGLADLGNLQGVVLGGDELVVSDGLGRTEVFSWKTGWRRGLALGRALAVSPDGKLVCLAGTPRELRVAQLPSMEEASAPVEFSHAISLARFSRDGRRLFVLTRDQRYYIFKVPPLAWPVGEAAAE